MPMLSKYERILLKQLLAYIKEEDYFECAELCSEETLNKFTTLGLITKDVYSNIAEAYNEVEYIRYNMQAI
jgi:hypothetical protein